MTAYKKEIIKQMNILAKRKNTIFLGQQVYPENFYETLNKVPKEKRLELPVAEEMQLGMSIGLALEGYLPISIYQRMDFLPRACDQLVNHLDLVEFLSKGKFKPKVIIRTTVGSSKPLDVGMQHKKDLTTGFQELLAMPVVPVKTALEVKKVYEYARRSKNSILIIEYQDLY